MKETLIRYALFPFAMPPFAPYARQGRLSQESYFKRLPASFVKRESKRIGWKHDMGPYYFVKNKRSKSDKQVPKEVVVSPKEVVVSPKELVVSPPKQIPMLPSFLYRLPTSVSESVIQGIAASLGPESGPIVHTVLDCMSPIFTSLLDRLDGLESISKAESLRVQRLSDYARQQQLAGAAPLLCTLSEVDSKRLLFGYPKTSGSFCSRYHVGPKNCASDYSRAQMMKPRDKYPFIIPIAAMFQALEHMSRDRNCDNPEDVLKAVSREAAVCVRCAEQHLVGFSMTWSRKEDSNRVCINCGHRMARTSGVGSGWVCTPSKGGSSCGGMAPACETIGITHAMVYFQRNGETLQIERLRFAGIASIGHASQVAAFSAPVEEAGTSRRTSMFFDILRTYLDSLGNVVMAAVIEVDKDSHGGNSVADERVDTMERLKALRIKCAFSCSLLVGWRACTLLVCVLRVWVSA
jgi:hypothetical protein